MSNPREPNNELDREPNNGAIREPNNKEIHSDAESKEELAREPNTEE